MAGPLVERRAIHRQQIFLQQNTVTKGGMLTRKQMTMIGKQQVEGHQRFENISLNSNMSLPKLGSGDLGALKRKDVEILEGGNHGEKIIGSNIMEFGLNVEGRNTRQDSGDTNKAQKHMRTKSGRAKSIYVGQWDTIKEKMVW